MDKDGNLVQAAKIDFGAKIKSEQPSGKMTMSEAHDINKDRAEYFRQLKIKEIGGLESKKSQNKVKIDKMKGKVDKLQNDLLILQNLYAHICLDKKALDRCETNDSMVDPEMSLGYSMSGLDFDQTLSNKKLYRRKKKVKRRNQID